MKFMDKVNSGIIKIDSFDDYVDMWHESETDEELHEYLGMTFEEYCKFVNM